MTELQSLPEAKAQDAAAAKLAQHRSESNSHYTPRAVVEAARELMGGIDLDPFSCHEANKVVRAAAFIGLPDNGFTRPWTLGPVVRDDGRPGARIFCNPPGGKLDRKTLQPCKGNGLSSAALAWAKLIHEWQSGNVEQALFVGFNLEILRTSQGWTEQGIPGCSSFPCNFPSSRLCFWNEDKSEEDSDPTCANVLVYVPPRPQSEDEEPFAQHVLAKFRDLFSPFGEVKL